MIQLIHRGLFFIFGFPVLEILVFFLAIGGDPKGLKLAVVDEELGNFTNCMQYSLFNPTEPVLHKDETCDFHGLSCNYLNRINQSKVIYYSCCFQSVGTTSQSGRIFRKVVNQD
jgi:hypothetical protein